MVSNSKTPSKDRIMRDLPKLKPKYLEVLVVGDSSFVKKQGSKEIAERYIKAIIKMVRFSSTLILNRYGEERKNNKLMMMSFIDQ